MSVSYCFFALHTTRFKTPLSPGNLTAQPEQKAAICSALLPLFLNQLSLKYNNVMHWQIIHLPHSK